MRKRTFLSTSLFALAAAWVVGIGSTFLVQQPSADAVSQTAASRAAVRRLSRAAQPSAPVRRSAVRPVPKGSTKLSPLDAGLAQSFAVSADLPKPLPTNAWWSGGILEPWPAPLFAWPLVTTLGADGVTVTAPSRLTIPRAVVNAPKAPLRIQPVGKTVERANVLSWGDWDVTFRIVDKAKSALLDVTAVQGSPFVQVRSSVSQLTIDLPPTAKAVRLPCQSPCISAMHVTSPDATYVLSASVGSFALKGSRVTWTGNPDGIVGVSLVASGTEPGLYAAPALAQLAGTRADWRVTDKTVETTYKYPAATLYGILPHHLTGLVGAKKGIGSYPSIRGEIVLKSGTGFTVSLPRRMVPSDLPLDGRFLSESWFKNILNDEAEEPRPLGGDVYGAAKDLLRSAQLADLAAQSPDTDAARKSLETARAKLAGWCGESKTHSFAYDERVGGLIAQPPAFGSEHYNDHHFHAGYFIHTAAILAQLDRTIVTKYGDCINLLIRDVASGDRQDPSFPYLRSFDPYAGHSWANGLTRLNDGNNQESTSEAIHTWHAVALWGRVSGDAALEQRGIWLMTNEALAARVYWLNAVPEAKTFPADFPSQMISILWGGKIDYATFFDGSDEAVNGIQFFPVTPSLLTVVDDNVISRLARPVSEKAQPNIWKTGLSLVSGLTDAAYARKNVSREAQIDPGLSRTYTENWLATLERYGAFKSQYRFPKCFGAVFEKSGKRTALIRRMPSDADSCVLIDDVSKKEQTIGNLAVGWNAKGL